MELWEIITTAIALSMDAFAVAICKGLSVQKATLKQSMIAGVWFGGFQGLMPLIGFFVGQTFASLVKNFDHWIAFVLLLLIGGNMIKESFSKEQEEMCDCFGAKSMLLLAISTSIDALAVGITFSCLKEGIAGGIGTAVLIIGITTFIFSAFGVKIGNVFGACFKNKAEFCGGAVLILIGTKILLEHLEILKI